MPHEVVIVVEMVDQRRCNLLFAVRNFCFKLCYRGASSSVVIATKVRNQFLNIVTGHIFTYPAPLSLAY